MLERIILFICFIFSSHIYSQTIKGQIKDSNGQGIENASVLVWESSQKQKLVGYFFTNSEGNFTLPINLKIPFFIEFSCINFKSFSQEVKDSNPITVVLEKNETILEEVTIKNERPIRVKNDSTFYDPSKFLNGTERKVEDLLKKLPGITVNESTGEIKFKGKSIETVKLEDDDLFGRNYTVGTKNISVDMVEQVQAIENYSANSLLKNIEDSDKVVLNLKLKKNKTDFSGSLCLKNGYEKKFLNSNDITILGINKQIKLFGLIAQSNYGINTKNLEPVYEETEEHTLYVDYFTKKNIFETTPSSILSADRTTFNDYFYSNNNLMYKLSPKVKIKNNIYFFKDNTLIFDFNNNKYTDNTETATENSYYRKPKYFRVDTKISYNTSKKSLLEADIIFKTQSINSEYSTIQNYSNEFNSKLKTVDDFFKSKLEFTIKLDDRKALQLKSIFSNNSIPQNLTSSPANNFITQTNSTLIEQKSKFDSQIFENTVTYLGSNKKLKNTLSLTLLNEKKPFTSQLSDSNMLLNDFVNDYSYNKSILSGNYFISFKINRFKFQPYVSINYIDQKIIDLSKTELLGLYAFNITYAIKKHSFYITNKLDYKTPSEDFLFNNNVVINNNSVKNNIISLDLMKTNNTSVSYKYDNLLKLSLLKFSFNYNQTKNSYAFNLNINPNFLTYTYFQNPTNIISRSLNLDFDKSIKKLSLSLKFNSLYSINNYQNAINNFEIRNNIENTFMSNVYVFSLFNFPVNFESRFGFSNSTFTINDSSKANIKSINSIFKIIIKPFSNTILSLSNEYYKTDLKSNNSISLYDFNFQYKSKKHKWLNFNLQGRNLLNTKNITQTNTNDFSTTIYQTQLINRHFLLSTNIDL